jgi:predicted membrane protein
VNVPLPPTDNLYKFLAIFGLIVALLSFIFPQVLIFEIESQLLQLNGEVVVLDADTLTFERGSKPKMTTAEEKQLRHRIAEVKGKTAVIKGLATQIKNLVLLFTIGIWTGLFFMVIGFWLWYFRVQKFQDRILKDDSEKRLTRLS